MFWMSSFARHTKNTLYTLQERTMNSKLNGSMGILFLYETRTLYLVRTAINSIYISGSIFLSIVKKARRVWPRYLFGR